MMTLSGNILLNVAIPWRITPAVRVAQAKWSLPAKAYHADQSAIRQWVSLRGKGSLVPPRWPRRQGKRPKGIALPGSRYRVGLAVYVRPTKKGAIPQNRGDWDNYYKAGLDALVYGGFLPEDNAAFVAGPSKVLTPDDVWVRSGIYLGERELTLLTVTMEGEDE